MRPRYQDIIEAIQEDIRSGRVSPGQKLPSEAALVKKFATSRITVGRALRELQSRGLVERRAGSGSYVRESSPELKPRLFGLLIPDLGETLIFDPICHGIASTPEAAEHALLWGHVDTRLPTKEAQCWGLCRQFIDRAVDGVFFAPMEFEKDAETTNRKMLTALHGAEIPVVLLDRRPFRSPVKHNLDLVGLHNRHAGYVATEHLIQLGCKRIGFLAYQGAKSTIRDRMSGYYDALRDHGLAPNERVIEDELAVAHTGQVDAFVCVNDQVASTLMQAFLSQGIRIPDDLRVVGIDDVPYAALLPVPLTTVRQPCAQIGRTAMRAMLERIRDPRSPAREILLEGELIVRRSSGGVAANPP